MKFSVVYDRDELMEAIRINNLSMILTKRILRLQKSVANDFFGFKTTKFFS